MQTTLTERADRSCAKVTDYLRLKLRGMVGEGAREEVAAELAKWIAKGKRIEARRMRAAARILAGK